MCVEMTRPTQGLKVTCGNCRVFIRKDEEDEVKKGLFDKGILKGFEDGVEVLTTGDVFGEVRGE